MDDVVPLLGRLVAADSVNPAYGGPGEAAVAAIVAEHLARHGLAPSLQGVMPGRSNVVGVLAGQDRSRSVLLEAHMDTVSTAGMVISPFEPEIREGRLHGRGACDVKAGLAAMLVAVTDLADEGFVPAVDVVLAAVIDEEHAFRGATALCGWLAGSGRSVEAGIVAEPTDLRIVRCTKGVLRFEMRCLGRAAHSSKPWLGASAILAAARCVLALERLHGALQHASHPLLGPATGSVGTIRGGTQINIVPDACVLAVDRRLLPGERPAEVLAAYESLAGEIMAQSPGVRVVVDPPLLVDEPLETPDDTAVVTVARDAAAALALAVDPVGVPYGSDASKFAREGIPAIVFGPGSIDSAHAADESVPIRDVEVATAFYRQWIRGFR
jgi:acetylornithine deacetylase